MIATDAECKSNKNSSNQMPLTVSFYLLKADDKTIVSGCLFLVVCLRAIFVYFFFCNSYEYFFNNESSIEIIVCIVCRLSVTKNAAIEKNKTESILKRMPKEIENVIFNSPISRVHILLLLYLILDFTHQSILNSSSSHFQCFN